MGAGSSILIRLARGERDIRTLRALFLEYAQSLEIDLAFQGFAEELAGLPGKYSPPGGDLLLAECDGNAAGCAAFRRLEPAVCEMKRLYVRPEHRGAGLGRRLALRTMREARASGYSWMRLDTLASMTPAAALYRSLGFRPIEAYYANPAPGALYFEARLDLAQEKVPGLR